MIFVRIYSFALSRNVFNWFKEFQRGRFSLENENREDRPITLRTLCINIEDSKEIYSKIHATRLVPRRPITISLQTAIPGSIVIID